MVLIHVSYIAQNYSFFTHDRKQGPIWSISLSYFCQNAAKFLNLPVRWYVAKPLDTGRLIDRIGPTFSDHQYLGSE